MGCRYVDVIIGGGINVVDQFLCEIKSELLNGMGLSPLSTFFMAYNMKAFDRAVSMPYQKI